MSDDSYEADNTNFFDQSRNGRQQDSLPSSSTKKDTLVTKGSMAHLSTPLSSSSTKKNTLVTKGSIAHLSTPLSRNGSLKQIDHHKLDFDICKELSSKSSSFKPSNIDILMKKVDNWIRSKTVATFYLKKYNPG